MYLNDVLALRRGIHGFPGLGSAKFLITATLRGEPIPTRLKAYIPGWCEIEWPPVEWGIPQWVLDMQPKAEAKAVADARVAAEGSGLFGSVMAASKMLTPGGILVAPIGRFGWGPTFASITQSKGSLMGGRTPSIYERMLKPDDWRPPAYAMLDKGLPAWGNMSMEVLDRIIPKNPADPLAAYLRLVTIPYLPPKFKGLAGTAGMYREFFSVLKFCLRMKAAVDHADAEADVMGRSWDYDRPAQDAQLAIIDVAFNTIRDAIDHGTEKDAAFAYYAATDAANKLNTMMPKSSSDLMKGSTWGTIAKGALTAAAAMVSIVAGGVIAAPLVAVGLVVKDEVEKKAEAAIQKQVDQAAADLTALKAEATAWEQAAAAVVPDTYVLMVEQTEVGTYGKLEDVSAATITLTTPGDRFEVLLNGKSLGIRIRTSTGSMAVPDDIGVQIYAIARDQMTQFVGQAETEVAKSGGVPWWMIIGGGAAVVGSQLL